jgi:hypothetical protein
MEIDTLGISASSAKYNAELNRVSLRLLRGCLE